jgi:integrase
VDRHKRTLPSNGSGNNLGSRLHACVDGAELDGAKGCLCLTAKGPAAAFSTKPMQQATVYRMSCGRVQAAGVCTHIGCHNFRAASITEHLENSGHLLIVQQKSAHVSARTTGLRDQRGGQIKLDEVKQIAVSPKPLG